MSDKSNKFGYVGADIPTQSFGNNTGVFDPNDINNLIADNKWTTFGQLELIETQSITSSTATMDFTNLGNYNVHFLVYSNADPNTDTVSLITRLSNNGGSSFISSGYQYALQLGKGDGSFSELRTTSIGQLTVFGGAGTGANEVANGYCYFYNLLDSSKYSFSTNHLSSLNHQPLLEMRFGSGVYPTAETHNAIRILFSSGNINNLQASLYGIRYS